MLGRATLTIVVSRLMASTAAQTVSRIGSLARMAASWSVVERAKWTVTT